MFFHQLQNFSPYSGHLYDEMKVPFIKKRDGAFGRSDSRFDLMDREGYFPFRQLIRENKAYFISDEDLFDFLKTEGYEQGKRDFEQNLGVTYTSLQFEQQLAYPKKCLN